MPLAGHEPPQGGTFDVPNEHPRIAGPYKAASQVLPELTDRGGGGGVGRVLFPLNPALKPTKALRAGRRQIPALIPFGSPPFPPAAGCGNLTLCRFHPCVGGKRALGNGPGWGWGQAGGPPALSAGAGGLSVAPAGNPLLHTPAGAVPAPAAVPTGARDGGGVAQAAPASPQRLKAPLAWSDQTARSSWRGRSRSSPTRWGK